MEKIAYYLGQYHPTEVNNKSWGEGFTEWHNVSKARPLFPGHRQPKLPGRLGFYDLRTAETLLEQQHLAKEIGITAFCYWHYWFSGKRLLHAPLDKILALPDQGIKIMLGWANESWTGIWHGLDKKVILEQSYSAEELTAHAKLLCKYFTSERYLRVEGKPAFLIYRPLKIPNRFNYIHDLREAIRKLIGEDIYLIGNWGPGRSERISSVSDACLDAVVANNVGIAFQNPVFKDMYTIIWRALRRIGIGPEIYSYTRTIKTLDYARASVNGVVHSSVVSGWDNTPRSNRRGLVLSRYNRTTFELALRNAVASEQENVNKLLFIKSWNEWAEGNTLEPIFKEAWSPAEVFRNTLAEFKSD